MNTALQSLRQNWATPASVCLHAAVVAAFLVKFTSAAPPLPALPDVELAVEVLLMPPPPPPPQPAPQVIEEPPPIIQSTAEDAPVEPPPPPPVRKRPEVKPKPVPVPQVTKADAPPVETFIEAPPAPATAQPRTDQLALAAPVGRAGPPASYDNILGAHLQRNHRRAPPGVLRPGQRLMALLSITIDRRGKIINYQVERSFGNPRLDREIGPLMERSDPMPSFPPEMAGELYTFKAPIEFFAR